MPIRGYLPSLVDVLGLQTSILLFNFTNYSILDLVLSGEDIYAPICVTSDVDITACDSGQLQHFLHDVHIILPPLSSTFSRGGSIGARSVEGVGGGGEGGGRGANTTGFEDGRSSSINDGRSCMIYASLLVDDLLRTGTGALGTGHITGLQATAAHDLTIDNRCSAS